MEQFSPYYYISCGDTVYDDEYCDDYSYYRKTCLCEPVRKQCNEHDGRSRMKTCEKADNIPNREKSCRTIS